MLKTVVDIWLSYLQIVKDISTPQLDMSSRDKVPNSMRSQDEDKT